MMRDRPAFDLFLASWLVLFLELACIRWFPSHVLFLTFFTNVVLLAGFVGMSVGCLAARSEKRHLERTPVWLAAAVAAGLLVELFRGKILRHVMVGDQSSPDEVFFGTESTNLADVWLRVPMEVIVGAFFVLIAAVHVGPGQELGRGFARVNGRTRAYSINLLGSLAGIASFAACSYLELPPAAWFAAAAGGVGYLLNGRGTAWRFTCLGLVVLMTVPTSGLFPVRDRHTTWSPYYRVDFRPPIWLVETNLISHQRMEEVKNPSAAPYALPYLFQRDLKTAGGAAWPEFKRVLIIGAGSGNDVARATQWLPKDAHVDAVEIDPVIQRIGADRHPDKPYSDPRVKVHLTDGRNFLRRADAETYDLVIFALVDSLVLQSGHPNLRLESYLFTQESFADVARVLRPTGVCVVYNFFRQGWLVARLRDELRAAFGGSDPVVVSTPSPTQVEQKSLKEIDLDTFEPQGFTSIFAGRAAAVDPLRAAFDRHWKYWLPWRAAVPTDTPARFGPEPPPRPPPVPPNPYLNKTHDPLPTKWLGVRPATVEETGGALGPATDDWPFLYMRTRTIPGLTWRGIGLVLVLSGAVWFCFRPREGGQAAATFGADRGPMLRSFFLGAGFMLVETKAVVHMALLSGGTWAVNSVVFAAILLMSLAGALVAGWLRPRRLELFYAGLFGTLAVGLAVPLDRLLGYDPTTRLALAGLVAFAPIAFAGVIFAGCLARSAHPDRVYAANVAGALVGGLAENASVVLGFQYLVCVAVGFYALSSACGNRTPPAVAAEKSV